MADFGNLDYWRQHFRSANSDIFIVIEHAILIAASDYPSEFRKRRDQITERIFSCQLPRCFGCDWIKQQTFLGESEEFRASDHIAEFKVNGGGDEKPADDDFLRVSSNYSFDEAEALTEQMEEENQIVGEVLTIKEMIVNKDYEVHFFDQIAKVENLLNELRSFSSVMFFYQTDAWLFESLRRLQLMRLSVEVLKVIAG